jgi:Mg2+/Co2+ transporter CorB
MDSNFSLPFLIISLIALILVSAFFSSSETSMMSLNRYKLRHLAKDKQHKGAKRVLKLLQRTDKLLTVILLGNTFANILASAVATIIAVNFYGDKGVLISTIALTFVVLIFAEIAPKTLAARYPQRYAIFISWPLKIILLLLYPLVGRGNGSVKGLLLTFKINISKHRSDMLNPDELKSIVSDAAAISDKHKEMLVNILDLEKVSAEDLMVPKAEIIGIDLNDDWQDIMKQLINSQHTRLPLYEQSLSQLQGIVHVRDVLHLLAHEELNKDSLIRIAVEAYFIPETTPLNKQLLNFQKNQARIAMVVDEYGSIQGLLALDDILEEIVGEFTTNFIDSTELDIYHQDDGSYIIDGSASIRDLNRELNWQLPTEHGKTLSGLITAIYDDIPNNGSCIRIDSYGIEILQVRDNRVRNAKVFTLPSL